MFRKPMMLALATGKVAALSAMLPLSAGAQAVVDPPGAPAAVVPPAVMNENPAPADYPLIDRTANDQAIAESLLAQGFSNVHILREFSTLTVNAQRDGQPIQLKYSLTRGLLLEVNGVAVPQAPEETGSSDNGAAAGAAAGDDAGAGDTGGDDAGADDGADDGADGSDAGDSDGSDSDGGEGGESDGSDSDGASG